MLMRVPVIYYSYQEAGLSLFADRDRAALGGTIKETAFSFSPLPTF
jgi:hypothetical protein